MLNHTFIYRTVYLTVLLTGLFSLVYQTIWQRYLTFIIGSDSGASTMILTVFLSALSLGYWLAGIKSKNIEGQEIQKYGLVEIFIGLWAVLFPWMFKASISLIAFDLGYTFLNDLIITLLLIAPPAVLMGVTLPFLTQGLSKSFQTASKTHAKVYAINTLGACLGALLAGFYLLETLGLSVTSYLLGVLNILFGLLMCWLASKINFKTQKDIHSDDPKKDVAEYKDKINQVCVLLVAACSGYLLIALESYFIRFFSIVTDGSTHAYPTVVGAFVAAVGIGAGLAGKYVHQARKIYMWSPIMVLLSWLLIYYSLPYWPYVDYLLKQFWLTYLGGDLWMLPLVRFMTLFLVIGFPVTVSSMLLPLAFHFYKDKRVSLGKTTGVLYAVATTATIFGGLLGGFWLFKYLDYSSLFISYIVVMALMVVLAHCAVYSRQYIVASMILLSVTTCLFLISPKDFNRHLALTFYFQNSEETNFEHDSIEAATDWLWQWFKQDDIIASSTQPEGRVDVFVEHNTNQRMITINGRSNSGTDKKEMAGNGLLGLFPYLITEKPERVLVIGLGTGVTAGLLARQSQVNKVDVCEINAAVIEHLPHFDDFTANASSNQKVRLIHSDVIKHLQKNTQPYDMIISIPSNFWVAGVENLLTPEFYQIVDEHLNQGGTFVQWVPDYEFSAEGLLLINKSFNSVFKTSSLWRLTELDLAFVYQKGGIRNINESWIQAKKQDKFLRETLRSIGVYNIRKLLQSQLANNETIKKAADFGKIHTIDHPQLAQVAVKALYAPQSDYDPVSTLESHAQKKSAQ